MQSHSSPVPMATPTCRNPRRVVNAWELAMLTHAIVVLPSYSARLHKSHIYPCMDGHEMPPRLEFVVLDRSVSAGLCRLHHSERADEEAKEEAEGVAAVTSNVVSDKQATHIQPCMPLHALASHLRSVAIHATQPQAWQQIQP
eukprot:jgi/Ulvmu1/329/UM001_0333.1